MSSTDSSTAALTASGCPCKFIDFDSVFLTEHLDQAHQTYFEHLCDSFKYGAISFAGSISFFLHGLFPFIFTKTGSQLVDELHKEIEEKYRLIQEVEVDEQSNNQS